MPRDKMAKVREAYVRCEKAREALFEANARGMECVEDPVGIVFERYVLPTGESVVLFATPSWWDFYVPLTKSNDTAETCRALRVRAGVQDAA